MSASPEKALGAGIEHFHRIAADKAADPLAEREFLAQRAAGDRGIAGRRFGEAARAADLHIARQLDDAGRRTVSILRQMPVPADQSPLLEMRRSARRAKSVKEGG